MKRAAHFLLVPELAYSPPNDAIVTALLELGYYVDLFAPGGQFPVGDYGPRVTANTVEYGRRWIAKNILSSRWFKYDLFSGTSEDPMAVVGLLSRVYGRPSFTLADEIRSGSYAGNQTRGWKRLCRRGMQNSRFTIVNDEARISLQREYAGQSSEHPIIVYPGCFRNPPAPGDRREIRLSRGIPKECLVLGYSGTFNAVNGGVWMVAALDAKEDIHIWGQLIGVDPLIESLLRRMRGANRLHLETKRLSWREAWASMSAVDIGMAVYLHDGPQFQNMGTSSNRLCMFLAMGIPVIASRQPSFEFLERYDCGVLAENQEEFIDALGHVRGRLKGMQRNALKCAREYIDAPGRYDGLVNTLSNVD